MPVSSETSRNIIVKSTGIIEKTLSINVRTRIGRYSRRSTKRMDSIRESINRVSVVERLGSKHLEEKSIAYKGRAIIYVLIGLDYPDKFLYRVIEVKLNLVAGRTNGLITSELELGNEVLVGVLSKSTTLIRIKENIVNIKRGSDKRLIVSNSSRNRASGGILSSSIFIVSGLLSSTISCRINGTRVAA
jgi:hypothetical protein